MSDEKKDLVQIIRENQVADDAQIDLDTLLDLVQTKAVEAGAKAEDACVRSKYSVQDYWMCVEFQFQRFHDEIARQFGSERRCMRSCFRVRLNRFRRETLESR